MIPQELVNAIVDLVGDTESLKACSLASPSLCSASQRILLRSLTLKGRFDPSNYVATSTLFGESPHIAQYITNLKIELPHSRTALAGAHSIPEVLAKLSRVQQCTIEGLTREHCARWYELGEELTSALVDFLGRQPLESLCVLCVQGIPLSGFLPILTCAPTLSFASVSIYGPYDLLGSLVNPPSITALTLDAHTETVANLLCRPQYTAHTAALCGLSLLYGSDLHLIRTTERTLQHIRLAAADDESMSAADPRARTLPPLPALRSVTIDADFRPAAIFWAAHAVGALLRAKWAAATPVPRNIDEITITFRPSWEYDAPHSSLVPPLVNLETLALERHPHPRLRWRIRFVGTGREARFEVLRDFIRHNMPQLHEIGLLEFETYEPKWDGGFV